ncbi:MAG: alpha/beta hydrolase [Betaproteobacteria bacterium]|nr:MAG: alpha/beta hydrolase [Betaproteobacteria bacterium]
MNPSVETWLIGLTSIVIVVATLYIATSGVIAHIMTRAQRKSPHDDPTWDAHKLDRVSFTSRGSDLALAGWYLRAARADRAVVLVHGKDCCRGDELKTSTYDLVQSLVQSGLSVFMLDLRGHGESSSARMTYGLRERFDVLGAVDWLLERGYKPGSVGLLGASMGGACAIAATRIEPAIGALITDSAYADFSDMMQRRFRRLSGMPNVFLPGALFMSRLFTGVRFERNRPADDATAFAGLPMLVIHSDQDPFVPLDHAQQIATAAGAGLWVTQGEHHISSYRRYPNEYKQRVGQFFHAHLSGTSESSHAAVATLSPSVPLAPMELEKQAA